MVHPDGGRQSFGPPGFEFHSFQIFQKCLFFDLTLTSCLAGEMENKNSTIIDKRRNTILNASIAFNMESRAKNYRN